MGEITPNGNPSTGAQGEVAAAHTTKCSKEFGKKVAPGLYDAICAFCQEINRIYENQYYKKVKIPLSALWNQGVRGEEFHDSRVGFQRKLLFEAVNLKLEENTPISSFFREVFSSIENSKGFLVKVVSANTYKGGVYARTVTNSMVIFIHDRNESILKKHARLMGFEPPAAPKPKEKKPAAPAKQPPPKIPERYQKFCNRAEGIGETFSLELYAETTRYIMGVLKNASIDAGGKITINMDAGYTSFNAGKARFFMYKILNINAAGDTTLKDVLIELILSHLKGGMAKDIIIDDFLLKIFNDKKLLDKVKPLTVKFDIKCPWEKHPLNEPDLNRKVPAGMGRGRVKGQLSGERTVMYPRGEASLEVNVGENGAATMSKANAPARPAANPLDLAKAEIVSLALEVKKETSKSKPGTRREAKIGILLSVSLYQNYTEKTINLIAQQIEIHYNEITPESVSEIFVSNLYKILQMPNIRIAAPEGIRPGTEIKFGGQGKPGEGKGEIRIPGK